MDPRPIRSAQPQDAEHAQDTAEPHPLAREDFLALEVRRLRKDDGRAMIVYISEDA